MEGVPAAGYHRHDDMQLITESKRKARTTGRSREEQHELSSSSSSTRRCSSTQHQHRLKLDVSESLLRSVGLDSSRRISRHIDSASKEVPTELPLGSLSFGDGRKLFRTAERDVFSRFCYGARKIVCQAREGAVSRKVDVPFSHITALHVCFDHAGFDSLRIEAKVSFKSFSAVSTRPGKYPDWRVEDPQDANRFPESKCVVLEIEKGVLEKGFAKLLYTDPRLQRLVRATNDALLRTTVGMNNAQMMMCMYRT